MKAKKGTVIKPAKIIRAPKSLNKILPVALIVITSLVYFTSLNNEFTNWDDPSNVAENTNVRTFHGDSVSYTLKQTFSVSKDMVMYAPLTNLSFCIQYAESRLNPWPYHFANLILHLLNSLLVFCFIWLLVKQQWVAFITALLFAIHPMHVESVAWITGRIDVLYSLFYLGALCTYILYLKKEKWKWQFYALTFILFVLSAITKAAAVTLPVAFFAIDYFLSRKITRKTVIEKIPFLLLSVIFGYLAIYVQKDIASIDDFVHYNFFDKILFTCYALVMYLWKLVVPVSLSCCYNYPSRPPSSLFSGQLMYPFVFYISPLVIAAIAFLIYKSRKNGKDILFGFGFFLINVALVLPGLASRNTIIADRYTYISYIGLFFILARWFNSLLENKSLKMPALAGLTLFLLWCCYLTFQRCNVWHDSTTLWTDAIQYNPDCILAYDHRGRAYQDIGKNEDAIKDYNTAILLLPNDEQALFGRALACYDVGKYEDAVKDYNVVIQMKPHDAKTYNNLGNTYGALKKFKEAIVDFDSALVYNPDYVDAYTNRGNAHCMIQEYDEGIKDYNAAIRLEPTSVNAYRNRAITYFTLQKFQLSLQDAIRVKNLGSSIAPGYIDTIEARIKQTGE